MLIYSYECGYSLKSTPELNQFKKRLEVEDNIHFVAFSETNKLETFEKYPEYSKLYTLPFLCENRLFGDIPLP